MHFFRGENTVWYRDLLALTLLDHQKCSRLRCLLHVKVLMICFYLGLSGSILRFRRNIIKVGLKSWLLTCRSNITLSLPLYTGSVLKREPKFCNSSLSQLYFCGPPWRSRSICHVTQSAFLISVSGYSFFV
jgi:hypothetical protein